MTRSAELLMIVYDRFWSFDDRLWSKFERKKRKTLMQTTCKSENIITGFWSITTGKLYWCALLVLSWSWLP